MAERTTVIQYRNKTVTNIHSHDHDHVHINSPGDQASLLIAAIVVIGVLIGMVVIACLVSIWNWVESAIKANLDLTKKQGGCPSGMLAQLIPSY